MNFDPYDPVDPLGQDQPYEMQDHSPTLPPDQGSLESASRLVLERAQEQAIGEGDAVYNAISEELTRRKMDTAPEEPLYEQSVYETEYQQEDSEISLDYGGCSTCGERDLLVDDECVSCFIESNYSSGYCDSCSSHSDSLWMGYCPSCFFDDFELDLDG